MADLPVRPGRQRPRFPLVLTRAILAVAHVLELIEPYRKETR